MKISNVLLILCFTISSTSYAANSHHSSAIKTFKDADPANPYSEATLVDLTKGKLLYLSGQVEEDVKSGKMRDENITVATNQAMDNIDSILKKAGTNFNNVLRCDVYLKDMADWPGMNKEYVKRFSNGIYPSRVTVKTDINYRIEMACIAFVPNK